MNINDFLQYLFAVGAFFLGIIYLIGGLIVNLNLTRRGVVEYQILKVKYLAVGVIFIFQFLGVMIFAFIPVVILVSFVKNLASNVLLVQALSIPSILGAIVLLRIWSRYPPNTRSIVSGWRFWFGVSVVTMVFPLYVFLHQILFRTTSFGWIFNSILALLVGVLALMAQIYHYSSFYYGRPTRLGALDPIGMGIPTRVNLVCDTDIASSLRGLGLPVRRNIIHDIYLVDETDEHYIVSFEQVPGGAGNNKTYKINKDLVKVIMHNPDHMRRLTVEEKVKTDMEKNLE